MMDQHNTVLHPPFQEHCCGIKCISWSAIVAGALVGLGLSFLLHLFGIAIGLSAFTTSKEGIIALAVGGFIGLAIGGVVTMFFAGWVAGYLGRTCCGNRHCGALYGLITWCLSLVLTVLLAAQVGQFMSTRAHALSHPTSTVMLAGTHDNASTLSLTNSADVSAQSTSTQITVVDAEKAANNLGKSLFLTFILFFIGAVSSCFGGYCGLKPKGKCHKGNTIDSERPKNII